MSRLNGNFQPHTPGLTDEELCALQRAAECLDLDVGGLIALGIGQRYQAQDRQLAEQALSLAHDFSEPTVRSTTATADEILAVLSAGVWTAERFLSRISEEDPWWQHHYGRQCALIVALQQSGAYPVGPFGRSTKRLHRDLAAIRPALPDGFEKFPIAAALEFLLMHGVETTAHEVPYLQRHLVAGLKKHKNAPPAPVAKLDQEALPVAGKLNDLADPHAASVGDAP